MTTTTVDAFDAAAAEKSKEKPVSQWQIAWHRLRRHKLAMIGLVAFVLIVFLSLSASYIAPYDYEAINLDLTYAPIMTPSAIEGEPLHILGTDRLGRDIFSRLLYAGRISLTVALVVTIGTILIGAILGAVSGAFGGATDTLIMRFTDLMLTLPTLPLLLILSSSLRQFVQLQNFLGSKLSVVIIIVVLIFFSWMSVARLVRGQVLSLRGQEFVEASRALGSNQSRVIFRHLIPNSMAPIIVAATLGFGAVIIAESALSFLGFGVMPPVPTWGNMLNEARQAPLEYLFVQALSPGLMIFIVVLSINFIGDGLRDALDPRLSI